MRLTDLLLHQCLREAPLRMRDARSIVYQLLVSMQWVVGARFTRTAYTCELRQKRKNEFFPQQQKIYHLTWKMRPHEVR